MKKSDLDLPGAFLLEPPIFKDARGSFVKTYHAGKFAEFGVAPHFVEEFFSASARNVVRGMHFQNPPQDQAKLVYCIQGRVLDVLLDLRRGSPAFGQAVSRELSAENRLMFYIPTGIAHGFLSLEDDSVMVYKTTTVHSPAHDAGLRWDSFGFNWPLAGPPLVSERDAKFPAWSEFTTPFGNP